MVFLRAQWLFLAVDPMESTIFLPLRADLNTALLVGSYIQEPTPYFGQTLVGRTVRDTPTFCVFQVSDMEARIESSSSVLLVIGRNEFPLNKEGRY